MGRGQTHRHTDKQTDMQTDQHRDSDWPKGRAEWKSTETKKVALLSISPTHANAENYRPASSYAPQYLAYGVTEGNVPSL